MAYILKQDKTYTDKFGNEYVNAILAVDRVMAQKEPKQQANIRLFLFPDTTARTNWKQGADLLLGTYMFFVHDEDFNTYFSTTGLANYTDLYAAAYTYLSENNPGEQIDWNIWESDE